MVTTVETQVYSGRKNPTFTLDAAQEQEFAVLVQQSMASVPVAARPAEQLGYRGFVMEPALVLGLPPWLKVGQGLVVGEIDGVTTAWTDIDKKCEQWLKQHARAAGQAALVDPERGAPVPPDVIRPEGRRLGLADELLAGSLDFAASLLDELSTSFADVASFAQAVDNPVFADDGFVSAQLEIARNRRLLVAPSMAEGDFSAAAGHIAALLSAVDAAAVKVGGLQLYDLVIANINWETGKLPKGLAQQLGLETGKPNQLYVDNGVIVFGLVNHYSTSLAPEPVLFGFEAATLEVRLRADGKQPVFSIALRLKDAEVGIGAGPISGLLGGATGSAKADVELGVDSVNGLTLSGGASKKIVLPARTATGPLDLRELTVEILNPDNILIGGAVTVKLGPVNATVEGAGISLRIDANEVAGGRNPLVVGLKAPDGIGMSIDTGLVRGGGFLGERSGGYGGALQLRVGPVEVNAFGLLTLKPDFALVVVMSVRFIPGLDLSFGFTLNAVGGLVGIEHRLDGDALAAQVSTGALEHILFPPDPVAAAPAILHTLEQVFPVSSGSFVIGPMIEIGWGRPVSFITAQIGVILSLPDPKLAIIGRGRLTLPAPELPIVDLRVTVVAELDSDRFYMRASLVGSRIAMYPVNGDIGMLLRWNGGAEMAISAGGFHPRYTPPRELCDMHRLSMDMSPPAILRMRAESYFALTSNSVQLGARIDLSADLEVASIDGHFAFDALVIYAPHFSFLADLGIGISVRAFGEQIAGVSVQLHLEGPAPWRAEGHAEVEILFWSVSVDVGPFTWGDENNPPPAPVDPRMLVFKALDRNPGAWQALTPPGADRVVRLRAAEPSDIEVTVHPMGLFEVRQRAVPLETVLARVGPNPVPQGQRRVHLGLPKVGGVDASAVSEVTDMFAMGSFLDLSDDEKLSRPGFETMPAGVQILPPGERIDVAASRHAELRYETFVCDDESMRGVSSFASDKLFAYSVATALASGAAGASQLRAPQRYATRPDPIQFADAGKVVQMSKSTVSAVAGAVVQTYSHAAEQKTAADVHLARLGVAA